MHLRVLESVSDFCISWGVIDSKKSAQMQLAPELNMLVKDNMRIFADRQ